MQVNDKGVVGPPAHGATDTPGGEKRVFVDPNDSRPRAHPERAQEGRVTNPGVRTIPVDGRPMETVYEKPLAPREGPKTLSQPVIGPTCPRCGENTLKARMNRKAGQRVYCSNPSCDYDQSTVEVGAQGIVVNPAVKIVDGHGTRRNSDRGVRIVRQTRIG